MIVKVLLTEGKDAGDVLVYDLSRGTYKVYSKDEESLKFDSENQLKYDNPPPPHHFHTIETLSKITWGKVYIGPATRDYIRRSSICHAKKQKL